MKKILSAFLLLAVLATPVCAQTYLWRYRSVADCDAETSGKLRDLCYETGTQLLYKCVPSAGDCDTAGEWKLVTTTINTADIADVSLTATELAELETIGATTISANQWTALGGIAETLTFTELNLLDGITTLSGSNTGDESTATDSAEGIVELATIAETDTGTDTGRVITPDGLQGSTRNLRHIAWRCIEDATDVTATTDVCGDLVLPFTGTLIQDDSEVYHWGASCDTAGTTGTMVVDIHKGGTTVMTTNKLDIETTELGTFTATTQPDLTTTAYTKGDIITVDIDAIHTTACKGLTVYLTVRPD